MNKNLAIRICLGAGIMIFFFWTLFYISQGVYESVEKSIEVNGVEETKDMIYDGTMYFLMTIPVILVIAVSIISYFNWRERKKTLEDD